MMQCLRVRRAQSPAVLDNALALAERHIGRTTALVEQLLDVLSWTPGSWSSSSSASIWSRSRITCLQFTDSIAQPGSSVQVIASGPVIGTWDPLRLEQVITNLLSNAVKFGEGRPITITVTHLDGIVELTFEEGGIGMAPDQVHRVFDRFESRGE